MSANPYNPDADALATAAAAAAKAHMAGYDASHDWAHIRRVVGLARQLASLHPTPLDRQLVELAALLHDVGDRKYTSSSAKAADPDPVRSLLLSLGAEPALADAAQQVCAAVSWTGELADPARVARVMAAHPELAVVQDADRLDAIGAVGIARLFTYGGAKTSRDLQGSMQHIDDKLLRIQDRLKTEAGRELCRQRTDRLLSFQAWFADEASSAIADRAAYPIPQVEETE